MPPDAIPTSFMSSGCMVIVLTMAWYSGVSLPTLICWPCLVVRPAFMRKRLVDMEKLRSRALKRPSIPFGYAGTHSSSPIATNSPPR